MKTEEVLKQLDALFLNKQIDIVEPFLQEQLKTAMEEEDTSRVITIVNELIGFYRSMQEHEKSLFYCEQIITFLNMCGLEGTIPYATTLLNVATAYRGAGKLEEAIEHYNTVEKIYDLELEKLDYRYAGLYNNKALLYQELQEHEQAFQCLHKALPIISSLGDGGNVELAVTYSNLSVSCLKTDALEEAEEYAHRALEIFESYSPDDYHYGAALASMGQIQYKKDSLEQAIANYEKALEKIYVNMGNNSIYKSTYAGLLIAYDKAGVFIPKNGMELAKDYFETYGKNMLTEKFPAYVDEIAIGLVGEGSECFGFDDDISMDHDFGPGFCMWITKELFDKIGERLQAEYEKLPKIHKGIVRMETAQGKGRMGVKIIEEFYKAILQADIVIPQSEAEWADVKEENLAAAVNGDVFFDEKGEFTAIRNKLLTYYPKQLWIKKIAEAVAKGSQAGQYNYTRMMQRGEFVAAELAVFEFIKHMIALVYLLNKTYSPYYKWSHKGMYRLLWGKEIADLLQKLSLLPSQNGAWMKTNDGQIMEEMNTEDEKADLMEMICNKVLKELNRQGLVQSNDSFLEQHVGEILAAGLKK